jgi:hypothetical protein
MGCWDSQSAADAQSRGMSAPLQFAEMLVTQPVEQSVEALATVQKSPVGGPSTKFPQQKGSLVGQSFGLRHSMSWLLPGH